MIEMSKRRLWIDPGADGFARSASHRALRGMAVSRLDAIAERIPRDQHLRFRPRECFAERYDLYG